ncbi:oligosaccharide flippase family protein [Acinetobacter sp. YH12124]|uniref:oligosaccharide flippase family protein n=1 Tax=Acinetobacter sp. YH12124 TaxID=2601109 RepID=UPI0015D3B5DF|nr:oligosaccharide flippase family protein [Acinetobacter sp. YH12124]
MNIFSKKILSNSLWMMVEKCVSIFGLIFVTSYVAKYLGPTNFGKIAFTATLFGFVQTLTWFGNQEILFKRVSRNPNSGLRYLFGTQNLRKILFLTCTVPILLGLYYYSDFLTLIFGIATALAAYFVTQDIYTIYNNAVLHSYINAIVNVIGLGVALIVRYLIVFLELDYVFLGIPIVLTALIPYLIKKYIFNRNQQLNSISLKTYRKYYLGAGSALVLSALAVTLYTQVTSLMLVALTSTRELGIYAVAVTLGMSWAFINTSIITSVLSRIYQEKNKYQSYMMVAKLNTVIILVSLGVVFILVVVGQWLVNIFYGNAYLEAYKLIVILGVATLCSGLGTISARFLIKEEGYSYISKKMMCVALSALPISYLMIYNFGLIGAAYSVLLIELLSLTLFNYFYKNGLLFKIHFFPFFKNSLKSQSLG